MKGVNKICGLIDTCNVPITGFVKMVPSFERNETKLSLLQTYILAEVKHINLVTPINEVAIFHLHELPANVDGLPAANE